MDRKRLNRFMRNSPLRNRKFYHRLRYAIKEKEIRRYVAKMGDEYEAVKPLLIEAVTRYHWSVGEFYMYHYPELTPDERLSFVPEYEKNIFCDRVNDYESSKVFDSKWKTYTVFKKYFKRECCLVSKEILETGGARVHEFLASNRSFIVKPDADASGRGIHILTTSDVDDAICQIRSLIGDSHRKYVVEELINQSEMLSCFHPQSVNTVRIRSFRFDDRVEILPSNMRLGRGDTYVDNTGQGGISVSLDKKGKAVIACDEAGQYFETHPDTGSSSLLMQAQNSLKKYRVNH